MTRTRRALGRWFNGLSLARKLTAMGLVTGVVSVCVLSVALFGYDIVRTRARLVQDLSLLSDAVGTNTTAALAFGDAKAATETLGAVTINPHVRSAAVLLKDGKILARLGRPGATGPLPAGVPVDGREWHAFSRYSLSVTRPIHLDGEVVGTIFVESDLGELRAQIVNYGLVMAVVLFVGFGISLAIATRLQRVLSDPLLRLTDTIRAVTRDHVYERRAEPAGDDEIGELIAGFNEMLVQIQDRDGKLTHHQEQLERTVDARTAELVAPTATSPSPATRPWTRAGQRASSSPT